jgi:hypothetical protein
MGVGILDPNEPRDDFKLVYRAETKLNPPKQRTMGEKRKKREPLAVPAPHVISVGDIVVSRAYQSGGAYHHLFTGVGDVKAITVEQRRSFSDGKVRDYQRVTVIVEGRRFDVLAEMLQYVGTPPVQVAPVVKPAPMPEKVEVIDLYPLLLAPPQIAGYLPARTKDNERTVYAIEAQLARQRVRGTSDLPMVDIGKRGQWVKIDGEVVKVRMG